MSTRQPACPVCGAVDAGAPDPLGVYACAGCGVEFRPPVRMPIRKMGDSIATSAGGKNEGAVWVLVAAAIVVGIAIAAGDSESSSSSSRSRFGHELPPIQIPPPIELPQLDPGLLDMSSMYLPIELPHEVHVSQMSDGRLFATGLLHNNAGIGLREVTVELRELDLTGSSIRSFPATVACPLLDRGQACAWKIDVPAPAGELEFRAFGTRDYDEIMPALRLQGRFDADARAVAPDSSLALDLDAGEVRFSVGPGVTLIDPWASVASFDASGQVLDVRLTRWTDSMLDGREQLRDVELPRRDAASYEVRVGGRTLEIPSQ